LLILLKAGKKEIGLYLILLKLFAEMINKGSGLKG